MTIKNAIDLAAKFLGHTFLGFSSVGTVTDKHMWTSNEGIINEAKNSPMKTGKKGGGGKKKGC